MAITRGTRCSRRARHALTLLAVAGGLGASGSPAALAAVAVSAARPDVVLSNETTSSTWSVADSRTSIRGQPQSGAARVGTLQFSTPDGFLQSYLLLREHWTRGVAWVQVRIPGRPNGRVGWVPGDALDVFNHTNLQVVVNRAARRLTVYRGGRVIYQAPVGVGKPSTPTPPGHFWITEAFPSSDPTYGPYAFGTSDYSTLSDWIGGGIVGMHGTNEPALVPGAPSHGCIRLHNSDIRRLSATLSIGVPLLVR